MPGLPMRVFSLALVAILTCFCLTACTPQARIGARLVRGNLQFAVCDGVRAQDVKVEQDSLNEDRDIWEMAGDETWGDGHVITYGKLPPGWTPSVDPETPDLSSDQISLVINSPTAVKGGDVRVAVFETSKLLEGKWIRETGDQSDTACG